jgi:hypothetical protein
MIGGRDHNVNHHIHVAQQDDMVGGNSEFGLNWRIHSKSVEDNCVRICGLVYFAIIARLTRTALNHPPEN